MTDQTPTEAELAELEQAASQGTRARFVILNKTRAEVVLRLLAAYRELRGQP